MKALRHLGHLREASHTLEVNLERLEILTPEDGAFRTLTISLQRGGKVTKSPARVVSGAVSEWNDSPLLSMTITLWSGAGAEGGRGSRSPRKYLPKEYQLHLQQRVSTAEFSLATFTLNAADFAQARDDPPTHVTLHCAALKGITGSGRLMCSIRCFPSSPDQVSDASGSAALSPSTSHGYNSTPPSTGNTQGRFYSTGGFGHYFSRGGVVVSPSAALNGSSSSSSVGPSSGRRSTPRRAVEETTKKQPHAPSASSMQHPRQYTGQPGTGDRGRGPSSDAPQRRGRSHVVSPSKSMSPSRAARSEQEVFDRARSGEMVRSAGRSKSVSKRRWSTGDGTNTAILDRERGMWEQRVKMLEDQMEVCLKENASLTNRLLSHQRQLKEQEIIISQQEQELRLIQSLQERREQDEEQEEKEGGPTDGSFLMSPSNAPASFAQLPGKKDRMALPWQDMGRGGGRPNNKRGWAEGGKGGGSGGGGGGEKVEGMDDVTHSMALLEVEHGSRLRAELEEAVSLLEGCAVRMVDIDASVRKWAHALPEEAQKEIQASLQVAFTDIH